MGLPHAATQLSDGGLRQSHHCLFPRWPLVPGRVRARGKLLKMLSQLSSAGCSPQVEDCSACDRSCAHAEVVSKGQSNQEVVDVEIMLEKGSPGALKGTSKENSQPPKAAQVS